MANVIPIVHVVDDDLSYRTAVANLLMASGYRVALYESGMQLLTSSLGSDPGCIVLDVQMAGLSGTQLQERLAELKNRLPIVFVTGRGDIKTSVLAIKAGAEDFLTKPVSPEILIAAIKRALVRWEEIHKIGNQIDTLRSRFERLTFREREVLTWLVSGKPHKQIAHALGLSVRTIKMHRHNIMRKCQVQSLAELAVISERFEAIKDDRRRVE